ncbi:MAG: hypothetical protein ABFC84_11590 [Veillonellales bacterium]
MEQMLIMPVANGVLPRPHGGKITGMFIMEHGGKILSDVGAGHDIFVCSWSVDKEELYPVGVTARIMELSPERAADETGQEIPVLMAVLEGREHARWHTLRTAGSYLFSTDVEIMNLAKIHQEYPSISGAGWMPAGGYTEFRGKTDIPVTIYGSDLENGEEVSVKANLGGLVKQEQAHTIEHAVIRALRTCGLCTARTLLESVRKETEELKQSVETSIRYRLPEVLGRTATGACGNAMTNLAQFYLTKGFIDNVQAGKSLNESLDKARRHTMSQLTQDLGLTMQPGLRVLQGLKKGMSHDDTPLKLETCKKVIRRFPFDPWE